MKTMFNIACAVCSFLAHQKGLGGLEIRAPWTMSATKKIHFVALIFQHRAAIFELQTLKGGDINMNKTAFAEHFKNNKDISINIRLYKAPASSPCPFLKQNLKFENAACVLIFIGVQKKRHLSPSVPKIGWFLLDFGAEVDLEYIRDSQARVCSRKTEM